MVEGGTAHGQGPVVSVVVPVRDRVEELDDLFAALRGQTLSAGIFEVLIADDGSGTKARDRLALEAHWAEILHGPPINAYAARNRAVRTSRAPVVAFCDSDCRPLPDWLEVGLAAMEDAELVTGPIRSIPPSAPSVWTMLDVEYTFDQEHAVRMGRAATANLFVRKEIFDRLGGFDESMPSGGDYEFVERAVAAGARLRFEPRVVVLHPTCDRAWPFLRRMSWRIRWYATRSRRRQRLRAREVIPFIPVLGAGWDRRQRRLPLRLDRPRLGAHGLAPCLAQEVAALAVVYLVFPWVRIFAAARGLSAGDQTAIRRRVGVTSRKK